LKSMASDVADNAALPLSVVIPAYNRETMIGRAVQSAFAQTPRPPAEVIVVDDCSDDATGAVAREHGATVIRHEANRGEGGARNTGIAHAKHPWIALLDSDDEWLPHLLDTLWRLKGDHVLVGAASLNCGDDPGADRFAGTTKTRPAVLRSPAALIYPENYVAASGTMVRADAVRAVGGYDETLSHGADLDLWLRVLEHGTGVVAPVVGVIYHLHDGQVTNDHRAMAERQLHVLRSYADRDWWSGSKVEAWRGAGAWDDLRRALRTRDRGSAISRAGFIARDPRRAAGVAGVLARRARLRRRSAAVTRKGTPTVTRLDTPHALLQAARRPPGVAVVDSRAKALAARAIGSRPVNADQLAHATRAPWSPEGR